MSGAEVKIQVSQEIIDAHVRSAVMSVLAKDSGQLVKAVVDAAMNQKRDSYSRQTIWEEKLNAMIREVAEKYLTTWLEEQRGAIEAALKQALSKKGAAADIAAQMITRMAKAYVSVSLRDSE